MIYFDANASEILRPEALSAAVAALSLPGNPASIHSPGRAARRLLEHARGQIAALAGAAPENVILCSGATEANATAIAALGHGRRVLAGATEHPSILAAAPGATMLSVHADGTLNLDNLAGLLAAGGPALVCLMLANNETGVLHPVARAAALCRAHGALLHVDAVQAAGRMKVDIAALGATTLSLSGHKIGGPKGAGALVVTQGGQIAALIPGGGQEAGRRGGTPALPAIAGFGAAAAASNGGTGLAVLRDRLEQAAVRLGAIALGAGAPRLPNTSCLALPGARAETQLITLDLAGIAVSAGSACSSGRVTTSHVLHAMAAGALAGQAIRVSLPWSAAEADVDIFLAAYASMAGRLARESGSAEIQAASPSLQPA